MIRFLGLFGLLIGAFYLFYASFTQAELFGSYLAGLAEVCGGILRLLGQAVTVNGASIVSPRFSIEVATACDGLEAAGLFVSAVLASPVSVRSRACFAIAGTLVLLTVNMIRIVSLFCVGVYFPKAMDTMHFDAWLAFLIVAVLICWLIWARWAVRRKGLFADVSV